MTNTTTDQLRAVRITTQTLDHLSIDSEGTMTSIQKAVGCRAFDVVTVDGGIDFFVDDEGAINGSPLNLPLTVLAHILGTRAALFGNAVLLGANEDTGDTISLNDDQLKRIVEAVSEKPSPIVVEQLRQTFANMPAVLGILAGL
jgi:hypothetical protein